MREELAGEPSLESPREHRKAQERQESPGEPRTAQESTGEPWRAQESPGARRRAEENAGEAAGSMQQATGMQAGS